jgi:methionyl-tRNA formyltransferase
MNQKSGLRLLFAGTPDFAVPALEALIEAGLPPVAVLTQPDRPAGRGRQLQASPVKTAAERENIVVFQPVSLKDEETQRIIADQRPDLMIVVAYGLMLPAEVLKLPRYGCWNIHASLLPRWRGAAPVQRAIEAGDRQTGICIMQMDEGLDTGPVIERVAIPLHGTETGGELHDRLSRLGADTLVRCVRSLAENEHVETRAQSTEGVTYAAKLLKSEAEIDWRQPAELLERKIRAFSPWPVAWCQVGGERTRIWEAELIPGRPDVPAGTVLGAGNSGIDVATGKQALRLLQLQPPGKRRMSAADYLNARSLPDTLIPADDSPT